MILKQDDTLEDDTTANNNQGPSEEQLMMIYNFMQLANGIVFGIFEEWIWTDCLQCYDYILVLYDHLLQAI